ncbi:MAG: holo-[acyl-carrier protein] synthase [Bradymonadia bacterium]
MSIRSVGIDTVHVPSFREQLADAASSFVASTFTVDERAYCDSKRGVARVQSYAARFAVKEAFVKAWSGLRFGEPPMMTVTRWPEIEVQRDVHGRPAVALAGATREAVESLGDFDVLVSLSHDGDAAVAIVMLQETS